jgi:uncharacterized glyoxalase superfamily protein PhnB
MTFLAPLFLLGALAVGVPVVYHLIRRSSREKTIFSSLMFLQPTPPRVTRKSRLEHIFLLLLRCLVIALLALGFARPFFQKAIQAEPSAVGAARTVMLIDTSASMRRENLWPEAKSKITALLQKAGPADQFALLSFDRSPQSLITFEQWNATPAGERSGLVAQRLSAIEPSWKSTHLGQALIAAAELFEEREQQSFGPRRIVLISDFQEGSRLEGLQAFEWPRGIELSMESVRARRTGNAGVHWIADESELGKGESAVKARVVNAPDSRRELFKLQWDGATALPMETYVPPGQSRTVMLPLITNGPAPQRLLLTGDDCDFDNAAYLVPPAADEISVFFIGSDVASDASKMLFYLERAFQQSRRQVVRLTARKPGEPIVESELAKAALIILADTGSATDQFRPVLEAGKTILLVMRSAEPAAWLSNLLNAGAIPAEEAAVKNYAMLGEIDFQHPLFTPFSDPRFSDFTKIHFWKHRKLDAQTLPGARAVARFDNGDPALLEIPVGRGRVLVLTSSWEPKDSQLALSSKFVPLLYSILEQADPSFRGNAPAQYFVGDEIPIPQTSGSSAVTVRKPDGQSVILPAGQARFRETDLPGVYTITSAIPPARFAVNLDPAELQT